MAAPNNFWTVIGLVLLMMTLSSANLEDSNSPYLEDLIIADDGEEKFSSEVDSKYAQIDLLLDSFKRYTTVLSLPSTFSKNDQDALEKAILDAKNCFKSKPHYFIDQSNYASTFSVQHNRTSQGDPYCFPHFSGSKSDKLQFSRWEDQRNEEIRINSCSPIPKIIHQQWKDNRVPHEWRGYHQSWKTKNPDWVVMLWTDGAILEWISTHFPWFVDTFLAFPYAIERADAFRYFLMFAYGGVYVDIDFESVEPLDNYVPLLARPIALMTPKNGGYSNSLIISVPNHPFWENVISLLGNQSDISGTRRRHVVEVTGPKFINQCVKDSAETNQVCALSKELFHPCSYCEDICETCNDCYAIHHYAKQWNDWSTSIAHYYDCNPEFFGLIAIFVCLAFFGICLKKRLFVKKRRTHVLIHNQQIS